MPWPIWVPELVEVPGGKFLMGSTDSDAFAESNEKPQHTLNLPTYWIGKTEVTNAQFRPFVEGDGYTNREYWTEAGWAWRQQKNFTQPKYWNESPWNGPEQPVVGVNWFEALAYVRWLSVQTGHEFRLPTEAEWEKAARGTNGRIWPWGNTWESGRANSSEAHVEQTTLVDQYPTGASSYGALDMAGNVWEWCATQWLNPYPYRIRDEWEVSYLKADAARIVRGGSWSHNRRNTRGAYRVGPMNPDIRHNWTGLRIVSGSPLLGSAP